jgi:hypothetical protein
MLALAPGLSFCVLDKNAVFLDSRRDRYFALGANMSDRFLHLIPDIASGATVGPARIAPFVEKGIFVESRLSHPISACARHAARTEWRAGESACFRLGYAALAACSIVFTILRLRWLPFRYSVRDGKRRAAGQRHSAPLPDPAILSFLRVAQIFPLQMDCLPLATSLRLFLSWLSIDATLVVGVKLRPFAAHCWIEVEEQVVGDTIDRVRDFTPIRIVR